MRETAVRYLFVIFLSFWTLNPTTSSNAQWESNLVSYDASGGHTLLYNSDPTTGHRIPDFSHAGYKNGEELIPDAPVVERIHPGPDDDTQRIQDAVDAVSSMSPGRSGIRGAVLLEAGLYKVGGTVNIDSSGVILRGVGDGGDPGSNTVIHAIGNTPHQRTVIEAGGGWQQWTDGRSDTTAITQSVSTGSRELTVSNGAGYTAGDEIIIYHPCTSNWIASVDSGGTHAWHYRGWTEEGDAWSCGDGIGNPYGSDKFDIIYKRRITNTSGNTLTIDAPVFNDLDPSLSPELHIYKYTGTSIARQIGIEYLRIDIEHSGRTDENHAWNGIKLYGLDDGWVRGVTIFRFGGAGIITHSATGLTIQDVRALDPVSIKDSPRQYNFSLGGYSQLILIRNSYARHGRHHYVTTGGSTTSGIVFLRSTSEKACSTSEGHRHWSQGLLFDNHREKDHLITTDQCGEDSPAKRAADWAIGLYNRGNWSDHGWSTVYSVAWNTHVGNSKLSVQQPPTSQNFSIGTSFDGPRGDVSGYGPYMDLSSNHCTYKSFSDCEPAGYIEGTNRSGLKPQSLYEAQLRARGHLRSEENITYLSEISWTSSTTKSGKEPAKNANADGSPMILHGKEYSKGIGVHAETTITYHLDGRYSRFKADVGLDDTTDRLKRPDHGTVIFEVYAEDELKYSSGFMRWWYPSRSINLDVREVDELRLVVRDAGDGIQGDYATWADARLEKAY